ncbi:MAG: NADH-quinone oxidoreductase subunit NuoN [Phycisphaera sp.]|nr:NADH-quinone oxidoreductase subunit NuoN [Phycisphaera sp.]
MSVMADKLAGVWPEITLGLGACVCMALGLAKASSTRKLTSWVAGLFLLLSGVLAIAGPQPTSGLILPPQMVLYVKLAVVAVGVVLLLVAAQLPSSWRATHRAEEGIEPFDPANVMRGEFFAFFLFSLAGVMLTTTANDLVWLFLSLELVSLPTYVMVATSQDRIRAQESAVKYFFLGALAVAVFLYGFTLIYGATGFTDLSRVQSAAATTTSPLLTLGIVLAIVGISFKIAAVPMHFYTADVYQGAATPVTAFLAFVPKTAGFVAIIILLSMLPQWPTHGPIMWLLWIMAALTMTVGNVMGLLQTSVKRTLAYSSIAHSGYLLVGLLAGPALLTSGGGGSGAIGNGIAAVLFYLVAYALSTIGAFAVLGCVQVDGHEADSFDDISGLSTKHPGLAAVMLVCVLSLVGLPPLLGFIGKIYLFGSAMAHRGENPAFVWLVVVAVLNSAVSAVYYLRIIGACYFGKPSGRTEPQHCPSRRIAALVCGIAVVVMGVAGNRLVTLARESSQLAQPSQQTPAKVVSDELPTDIHGG